MKRKTFIIILFVFISSIIIFVPFAYSWFTKDSEKTIIIETDEYSITITASFSQTVITENSPYYDQDKKLIIINASDNTSPNYISNFTVSIRITSKIPARMRFKIQDEWKLVRYYRNTDLFTEEVLYHENSELEPTSSSHPFIYSPHLSTINDIENGYMYYRHLIQKDSIYNINYIIGGRPKLVKNTITYFEVCYLYFDVKVEMVQANRFPEVWDLPINFFG